MVEVAISELWFPAQVDLRIETGELPVSVGVPVEPNTWSSQVDWEWLWLGPDEWLAVGPPDGARGLIDRLERELEGRHRSIVDVGAGRAAIDLAGAARYELLSHGCGIDLHPRSWSIGRCAQTLLARVPVILQERNDMTRVFVRPSFAEWLGGWLAARVADLS